MRMKINSFPDEAESRGLMSGLNWNRFPGEVYIS